MSQIALIAIVVGASVTVLTIGLVGARVVQRVGRAIDEATRATERLTAASAAIADHQQVTTVELERLADSVERLHQARNRQ